MNAPGTGRQAAGPPREPGNSAEAPWHGNDHSGVALGPAAERLAASREAIARLLAANGLAGASGASDARSNREEGGAAPAAPRHDGLTAWVRAAAQRGGLDHPLLSGLGLLGALAYDRVAAVAQRRPWVLVGGAALAGACLVAARPWRLVLRPTLLVSVLSQVALRSWAQGLQRRSPEGDAGREGATAPAAAHDAADGI